MRRLGPLLAAMTVMLALQGCVRVPWSAEARPPGPTGVVSPPTAAGGLDTATPPAVGRPCPITQPNRSTPPGEAPSPNHHGNGELWTAIDRDDTGVLRIRPDEVETDGSLGRKMFWWRGFPGSLTIEGRRLDAPAAPLRARIPAGYGPRGFQSSAVYFPSDGCWEVTGRIVGEGREGRLTFVVLVARP